MEAFLPKARTRRPIRQTARLAVGVTINLLGVAILVSQLLPLN